MASKANASELSHDRLGFTFCLALALHAAIILGISFEQQQRQQAPPMLEITLAQHRSEKQPNDADFLAQYNQLGSGTLEEVAMLTSTEQADFHDTRINPISPLQQQASQTLESVSKTILSTPANSQRTINLIEQQQQPDAPPEPTNAEHSSKQLSKEIASLEAKLDIQQQAYAKRPRIRRLTSMATQQSDNALYLHNWRTRIETIGNQHYPAIARRQGIHGDLRLLVSLLPNGEVHKIKVLASSGHKVLDEAAIRIVHLAAPYPPFSVKMSQEVDVLEIIRTWKFHKNRLSSSS